MGQNVPQTGPRSGDVVSASQAARQAARAATGTGAKPTDPDASKVWIEGREYDLDTDFTFDELIMFEEQVEMDVEVALAGGARMKGLAFLVYLLRRRDDPSYTFEQAKQLNVKATTERPTAAESASN